MPILAGALVDAPDLDLPDPIASFGNGVNTITAAAFAVLPTVPCTAVITNPHPTAAMLTMVAAGAWMVAASGDVRMAIDFSGALTIAPGIGGGAAIGWGEIPVCSTTPSNQFQAVYTVALPPGTTTARTFGLRTGAGTVQINYPTLRLIPLAYIF
jgi:hypothetical protein